MYKTQSKNMQLGISKRVVGVTKEERLAEKKEHKKIKALASAKGKRVKGKVIQITDDNVQIDVNGVAGVVDISECSGAHLKYQSQPLKLGRTYDFVIIEKKLGENRNVYFRLSLKPHAKPLKPKRLLHKEYKTKKLVSEHMTNTPFTALKELISKK